MKSGTIPGRLDLTMGFFALIYKICKAEWSITRILPEILLGLLPGICLLGAAELTKEAIGKGDGILMLMIGAFLTGAECVGLLGGSLFFMGILSIVLMVSKKADRKTEIPFAPVVFLVYMGMVIR